MLNAIWIPIILLSALALFIPALIVWVWAIVDCLQSRLKTEEKVLWVVIIVFLHIVGALLYFLLSQRIKGAKMRKKGKRLVRTKKDRMLAGVCGGIAQHFGIDSTLVRLLFAFVVLFGIGAGVLFYIIAWIIIPEEK